MAQLGWGVEAVTPSGGTATSVATNSISWTFTTTYSESILFAAVTANGYSTSTHSWTSGWTQVGIMPFATNSRHTALYVRVAPATAGTSLTFTASESTATGMAGAILEVAGVSRNAAASNTQNFAWNVGTTVGASTSHLLAGQGTGSTPFPDVSVGPMLIVSAMGASAALNIGKQIIPYGTAGVPFAGSAFSTTSGASNGTSVGLGACMLPQRWDTVAAFSSYAMWVDNSFTSRTAGVVSTVLFPFSRNLATMGIGS